MTVNQPNQQQSATVVLSTRNYNKGNTVSTNIDGYKLVIKPDPEKKNKVDIFITATEDALPLVFEQLTGFNNIKVGSKLEIELGDQRIDDINFEGSKSTKFTNLNISGELDIVMDSSSGDVTSIDLENSSVGEAISISTAGGDETVTLKEVKTPDLYIGVGKGEDKVSIQGGKIGRALTKGADTREINANIESINDDD